MKLLCPPKVKRIAVLLKVDLLYECEECCCILVSPSEAHNCCQIWINRRRGRSQTLGISNESSAIHRLWEPPINVEDVVRKWILSQSISVEVVVGESIFRILGISDESSAIHGYYARTPELLNTKSV